MAKPQPTRIKSDSCPVFVDGVTYYPHEGESVWLFPVTSVGELKRLAGFATVGVQMAAIQGDPDQGLKELTLISDALGDISDVLASRIVNWDWTDLAGRPFPKPGEPGFTPAVLCESEIMWLMSALRGQVPDMPSSAANEKKDSASSPITSSASAPPSSQT